MAIHFPYYWPSLVCSVCREAPGNLLSIELEEATPIRIVTMLEKTVATQMAEAGLTTLDVSGLVPGVYSLQTDPSPGIGTPGGAIKFVRK